METCAHIFQISGIKTHEEKRVLVQGVQQLGGKYIGGSVYQEASTHLIIPQVLSSEKFFAACAAGKWVVTPDYVLESVKNGSWLVEGLYEVAISTGAPTVFYPARQWREKVASGRLTGAFQGWKVLLVVQEPSRRAMFKRLLTAGKAEIYNIPPPGDVSITHVIAKPITENSTFYNAPCYPVTHIVQHLFGSNCIDMNFNITDDHPAEMMKADVVVIDFSKLETELKDYVVKQQGRSRLSFLEFLGYRDPHCPQSQAETDFSDVGTMIECGLFTEALDSVRSAMLPGLLPPVPHLTALLDYAQQENATPFFQRNFLQVMYNLLLTNPPWMAPSRMKKYFSQVLQCPRCKMGLWPFLQTAVSYCLSSEVTCHPLPAPASPTLRRFHHDLVAFVLKLFQGELHSITAGDFVQPQGTAVSQASASGSLLYGAFWTVWERSTLLSQAVKQLTQLLVHAASEEYDERAEKQRLCLADTLLELLSVLVEFWCQQNFKLNQNLVEKGLQDLAEHLTVISQDVAPAVVVQLVVRVSSTRLKVVMADAIFRSLCCRSGLTLGDEPLSLKKMVLSYLPALGRLARSPSGARISTGPTSHSCTSQETDCRSQSSLAKETMFGDISVIFYWCARHTEGDNGQDIRHTLILDFSLLFRLFSLFWVFFLSALCVLDEGETLLHRACKKNQVETVLQILALPGTDVNIKDYAGWTPLHEACNHGSTACVEALLRYLPAPVLHHQVGGVSPLNDALRNGHVDIAKLLLEHAGSSLLQQTDGDGHTALDLVSSPSQREELLHCAQVGDTAAEVWNLPLLEAGSTLLAHLIFSYQQERGLPGRTHKPCDGARSLGHRLVKALETHSYQTVTSGWTDQRAVRLTEDVETLLELSRGMYLGQVSQAVRECTGQNSQFLMEILEHLKCRAQTLVDGF
ncbi:SMC5-SMC6 complex localization factor 1 [Solea senegalensis]|uniref:SMC5-SMC6 complex localization factor 1 n=1 Tax=Solea senegalensis TaxID=28829 RepID=A0AAV6QLU2_SOLSE|nr:SMC5-SMC6 complex localization factor 1 [Solea senegalensis]